MIQNDSYEAGLINLRCARYNQGCMNQRYKFICCFRLLMVLMVATVLSATQTQKAVQPSQQQPSQSRQVDDIPVMDGEAGPCSVEFTVTDAEGKPVMNALINVHIVYGFAGVRKLDTALYTNAEGKGKFIGLPAKVHKPPLEFRATKDQLTGVASYNPATECQAKHSIVMEKKAASK